MEDPRDRSRDIACALFFIAIGIGAVAIALNYPLGTPRRMGPGALPFLVGGLMVAVGIALAAQAWARGNRAGPLLMLPALPSAHAARAVIFVTLSLIVFALLIRPAGLFLATAALAVVARQAEPGASLFGTAITALVLAFICSAIFVWAIGLPFRVWPA
jgi:hypothetical protein